MRAFDVYNSSSNISKILHRHLRILCCLPHFQQLQSCLSLVSLRYIPNQNLSAHQPGVQPAPLLLFGVRSANSLLSRGLQIRGSAQITWGARGGPTGCLLGLLTGLGGTGGPNLNGCWLLPLKLPHCHSISGCKAPLAAPCTLVRFRIVQHVSKVSSAPVEHGAPFWGLWSAQIKTIIFCEDKKANFQMEFRM